MGSTSFEIRILRQHWIKDDGNDDRCDLCSHGEVFVKLGPEELCTQVSGSWTLSATGLYLLRSLEQDCQFYEFSHQLLPCCGHLFYPDEERKNFVSIIGCPTGIDWKITHHGQKVRFEAIRGTKAELPFDQYRKMVLAFTSQIEEFYGDPRCKEVPDDEFDKDGFNQFWAEWHDLRNKWTQDH